MGKRNKVTIIGAGATGTQMAQLIAMKGLADVVLVDLVLGVAKGKARDLGQACALYSSDVKIVGTGLDEWGPTEGSDIIVNTAGAPRKPGQTREELAAFTVEVLKKTVKPATERSPNAVYLGFTNPMDAATQIAMEISGFPPERVVGQGGMLDTARFRYFLADELHAEMEDIQDAMVLGGHTERDMVPIVSLVRYRPMSFGFVNALFPHDKIATAVERTRNGGKEIVDLMGVSAAFAPAAATVRMVELILQDDRSDVVPCSVYYEPKKAFVGLPVRLGRERVMIAEDFFDMINPVERAAVLAAADATRALVEEMRKSL